VLEVVAGAGPELEDAPGRRAEQPVTHIREAGAFGPCGEAVVEAGEEWVIWHAGMIAFSADRRVGIARCARK